MHSEDFYLAKPEPVRGCLLALRDVILEMESVSETVKYGMPCFCKGKKAFVYLWTDKKSGAPYLLFVEGRQMDHPMLEQGDRARMKILRIDPNEDLPLEVLRDLLQEAMQLVG